MKNLLKKVGDVPKDKKLIIFDLDGTLTETKSNMDGEMAELLKKLLEKKKVAVIGGGGYEQFQSQFVSKLNLSEDLLKNLFLFPTTATAFYKYADDGWQQAYSEKLTNEDKKRIRKVFDTVLKRLNYVRPDKIYGEQLEDRGTQMSFSFLGQDVVKVLGEAGVELKKKWRDENQDFKLKVAEAAQKLLPDFEVRAAGYTTIDITRKGIDKEYGIRQIKKYLGVDFDEMLFVGDALFPGGNDYAALRTGARCFEVKGIEDTKKLIRHLIEE